MLTLTEAWVAMDTELQKKNEKVFESVTGVEKHPTLQLLQRSSRVQPIIFFWSSEALWLSLWTYIINCCIVIVAKKVNLCF